MIVVARHGRTRSNASGLLLGRADPSLDEVGLVQAEHLAAALASESAAGGGIDRILSSPLTRTVQTAEAVARALGRTVEIEERFVELDYGEWDERPISEVTADEWARWRADVDFAPPGGESLAALGRRVRSALDEVVASGERTLVVTHVSPIKAAVAWALGGSDDMSWRMFVAPASVTRIATARGGISLQSFNDCSHLRGD